MGPTFDQAFFHLSTWVLSRFQFQFYLALPAYNSSFAHWGIFIILQQITAINSKAYILHFLLLNLDFLNH
jgi:hypothetical protein